MYISRVKIDVNNFKNLRSLINLNDYHYWVENSFPEEINKGERSRKLWRIDSINQNRYLLIVSSSKPNVAALEKFGVLGSVETKNYDTLLNSIHIGLKAKFRVVLNPVISISSGKQSGKRGRRMPHITIEHQMKYLLDRMEKFGFSTNEDLFSVVERKFETINKKGFKPIIISVVSYQGMLEITNVELFKSALINGIGGKKAYGCGLLTIIPTPE